MLSIQRQNTSIYKRNNVGLENTLQKHELKYFGSFKKKMLQWENEISLIKSIVQLINILKTE